MDEKPTPRTYGDLRPPGGAPVPPTDPQGNVYLGVLYGFLLHVIQLPLMGIQASLLPKTEGFGGCAQIFMLFSAIGVTQVVYIGPAVYLARSFGRVKTANGILIAGIITFLTSASCVARTMF